MNEIPPNFKPLTTDKFQWPQSITRYLISQDEQFLEKVRHHIVRNLANEHFSVQDLADNIHLSVSQLNRKLNKLIGQSAGKLILEIRLRHAAGLLESNVASIGDIAYRCGFRDQAYFCRRFKKQFNCTPSTFRRRAAR
ncbi:helix-turn-helix transcriptional regulator [Flavilitoribacter nigricans]|uniref:HTH araC/xylS-type domain-containing protein n=1 Tax=Flavilitoribacter nigricans (strain ATCC 23147 / DSM 23189 / NBRC 102662 / NCIMB 1420 / SS-2) TaxID=1122177 RepID=A0A2D0NBU2_FLAN2|nr:helix-turn-helix transcriptional regulator [Flavilitoribacter nigricans]PHN05974.1 hypothetical protein CRP01_13450 [Flavilitoribacter nigricans DSM 23189 = NBRC 102662]